MTRCMDAGERTPPPAEVVTCGEVSASSIMELVTSSGTIPGCLRRSASDKYERSRRYALMVFSERPSAASLLPKASKASVKPGRALEGSGLLSSRSLDGVVFVITLSSFLGAAAHGRVLGQGQLVDAAGLLGPDQKHAEHPLGLFDRGRGALPRGS